MSINKARNDLNNSILFNLVKECGDNVCYRCGKTIEKVEELSIEHKEPYLFSENAKELFFDLNNITFSHRKCNCITHRKNLRSEDEKGLNANEINKKYLGMTYAAAKNTLFYDLLFIYTKKTNKDICFQCGEKINSKDELSVEHKIPYMYSEEPKKIYFDLDNIAFSHRKCNYGASRRSSEFKKPSIESNVGTSGYKGVRLRDKNKKLKYCACIKYNGKHIYLGYGNDPVELAKLYDEKAIELLGEDAITNKKLGLL